MKNKTDALALSRREAVFRYVVMGVLAAITIGWMLRGVLDLPSVPDNYTNGYSHSPGGHSALVDLLQKNGRDVRVKAETLKLPRLDGGRGDTLVLLEPRPEHIDDFEEDLRRVFDEARARPCSLVFAFPKRYYEYSVSEDGKEVVFEDEYRRYAIDKTLDVTGLDEILDIVRTPGATMIRPPESTGMETQFEVLGPVQTFLWKRRPELSGGKWTSETLLETEDGSPVAIRLRLPEQYSMGGVVLLSDPDLISNRYIGGPGGGTLALSLFAQVSDGPLIFEETLHGYSTEADLEYLAMTPPGLWLTLSVLLLLVLFGWREATVVRPASAEDKDRQARLYAVDGIARMMLRAKDHGAAYRALMRRSTLVLGQDPTAVKAEGVRGGDTAVLRGNTGRIRHAPGQDDEERLLNAAAVLAEKLRRETSTQAQEPNQQGQA